MLIVRYEIHEADYDELEFKDGETYEIDGEYIRFYRKKKSETLAGNDRNECVGIIPLHRLIYLLVDDE